MKKDKDEEFISTLINNNLTRIAHCMEEVLRLVKEDQERSRKYMEKESEQTPRASNGPRLPAALAMAQGQRLQEGSGKLQASSCKLDKTKL